MRRQVNAQKHDVELANQMADLTFEMADWKMSASQSQMRRSAASRGIQPPKGATSEGFLARFRQKAAAAKSPGRCGVARLIRGSTTLLHCQHPGVRDLNGSDAALGARLSVVSCVGAKEPLHKGD